jgi:hypothetical protein
MRGRGGVPEEHSHKPDPDEPWRYVCPADGGQVHSRKNMAASLFKCDKCGQKWQFGELRDKKEESDAGFTSRGTRLHNADTESDPQSRESC